VHNYLHLVGMTIFYYDYALTFGDEYTRIWKQRATRSNYLFFLNRYLTFFGDVAVNVGNFYSFKTTHVSMLCSQYAFYRQALLIFAQVVVCIILYLRTSALYSHSRPVSCLILGVGLSLAGLAIYAVVGQHSTISLSGGCHTASSRITYVSRLLYMSLSGLAVAWESLFVFDCMIFSLTMYKTWKHRQMLRNDRLNLVTMMSRDGNVSVTMLSRIMLNLHEGVAIQSAADLSSSDNITTLLFTSRIAMHEDDMLTGRILGDLSVRESRYVEDLPSADETLDQEEAIEMVPSGHRHKSTSRSDSDG
ncbi:hypothetical protein FOMPIDRAFT_47930, partial [Fomitopsis schrenkii]